mmetsp:Transcript_13193/g.44715  ORF Transcript_13193/g.44715 Transcript_13193/m.44715 type:complete len:335 (+) Transcript_13193:252-1256(+)
MRSPHSSDHGVGRAVGEAALVHAALNLEIALLTPPLAPRVAHREVVVALVVRAIAHGDHRVVHVHGIRGAVPVVHAAGVVAEVRGHVKGDGHGPERAHRVHNLRLLVGGDVDHAAHLGHHGGRVEGAGAILSRVRVGLLRLNAAGGHEVLVGLRREAAAATVVVVRPRAVHELLLREVEHGAVLEVHVALQGANGAERPAAPAVPLVLDGVEGAIVPPINTRRHRAGGVRVARAPGAAVGGAAVLRNHEDRRLEFVPGQVRELVQRRGPAATLGVDLAHLAEGLRKVCAAVDLLGRVRVRLAERGLEVVEGRQCAVLVLRDEGARREEHGRDHE